MYRSIMSHGETFGLPAHRLRICERVDPFVDLSPDFLDPLTRAVADAFRQCAEAFGG